RSSVPLTSVFTTNPPPPNPTLFPYTTLFRSSLALQRFTLAMIALPATARQPVVDHRQAIPAPERLIVDEEPGRAEDAAADRLFGTRLGQGLDLRIAHRLGGEAREFQHHAQVAHIAAVHIGGLEGGLGEPDGGGRIR